jgi:hypothetical protein
MTTEQIPDRPIRFHVDHGDIAQRAREAGGRWIYVRGFGRLTHAEYTAKHIRNASITAYQPAGAYETHVRHELECWPHRPQALYVRYVGQEA